MKDFILMFLFISNILGFILMYIDKKRAIKHKWRISENTLINISIAGGSIGILLGIYIFRHKIKHFKFTFGVPAILIVELIFLFIYMCYRNNFIL